MGLNKIVLGLTGGIASGKTTVLKEFRRLGARTFDCDRIARAVVQPGQPAYKTIARVFGKKILMRNGVLNRKALGEIVFRDRSKRKKLEAIVHPQVVRVLKKRIVSVNSGIVVADIPLLFEARLEKMVDKIAVVWVPRKIQCARVMQRNHLKKAAARRRIRSQWSLQKKKKSADFVIDNSGAFKKTKAQVRELYAALKIELTS